MRENRPYGSEGGEAKAFPTPINESDRAKAAAGFAGMKLPFPEAG